MLFVKLIDAFKMDINLIGKEIVYYNNWVKKYH